MTMQSELSVAGSATLQGGLTLKPSAGARKLSGSGSSAGDGDYDVAAPPVALLTVEAADGKANLENQRGWGEAGELLNRRGAAGLFFWAGAWSTSDYRLPLP